VWLDTRRVTEILGGEGETKFKFGQLIFRKIIKVVGIICDILRLKCTKFDFARSGSSQRSPKPIAGFKESYF